MPEGPEVRKYADLVDRALSGRRIKHFTARTLNARKWLAQYDDKLLKRRVLRVISHGKHLLGYIEGDYYFHSHLMMWGRWQTFVPSPPIEIDRRERARIVVIGGAAILYSAPIFNVGHGDPYTQVEFLNTLGPDALPYEGSFDQEEFSRRLLSREHKPLTIGAALLNQQIVAGLGNYLRAEILFACRINPWRLVGELQEKELNCLRKSVPELAHRSYTSTATATEVDRERMRHDPSFVYQPGREYGTRHLVFRRTNLPCLRCGEPIKQLRQVTHSGGDDERDRIIYFCAKCQDAAEVLKDRRISPRKSRRAG
ncbi:MAG TPA: DNA-formamidopyrimidine glycosylase family protein [Pyrinomonadaceae bacterium]